MLENGKIYIVEVDSGNIWMFKKCYNVFHSDKKTYCKKAICLNDMYVARSDGYVCYNSQIISIKEANSNYIAIWNRMFNDNVELT